MIYSRYSVWMEWQSVLAKFLEKWRKAGKGRK